jgi:YD repeat-containing protein
MDAADADVRSSSVAELRCRFSNCLTGNGLQDDPAGGAGNVTNDSQGHAFQYDAEGRLYSVNETTCFTYDGDGIG